MGVVLWHIELSHYSEKVRWALDHKGIDYERHVPMPGLRGMRAMVLTRGAQRGLPVVEIDGRPIGDSTAIIAALEDYRPQPALYPADAEQRRRALELEDYFDEHAAPDVRAFMWNHTLRDTDAISAALFTKPSPARERMLRATAPVAKVLVRADYGATERSAPAHRDQIRRAMDRLEDEIEDSGYLVGDAFTVADLTAAALFTPLLAPPERPYLPATVRPEIQELREELTARPGGRYVLEMYARHRARSAAPAAV